MLQKTLMQALSAECPEIRFPQVTQTPNAIEFAMDLTLILEAILFSSQKPLSLKELRDVFASAPEHAEGDSAAASLKKVKEAELTRALEELAKRHEEAK